MKNFLYLLLIVSHFSHAVIGIVNSSEENKGIYVVSSDSDMVPSNETSVNPIMTGNGEYIFFKSTSGLALDGNADPGYFVKDTKTNTISRMPGIGVMSAFRTWKNVRYLSVSSDGRYLTFSSSYDPFTNTYHGGGKYYPYLLDRIENVVTPILLDDSGNQYAGTLSTEHAMVSDDGKFIYLIYKGKDRNNSGSELNNAVLFDVDNSHSIDLNYDINGTRVDLLSIGALIGTRYASADGRYFIYQTRGAMDNTQPATGLNNLYLFDRLNHSHTLISVSKVGLPISVSTPSINADGSAVVFGAGWNFDPETYDSNTYGSIVLHDTKTSIANFVLFDDKGNLLENALNPSVSNGGSSIAFLTRNNKVTIDNANVSQVILYNRSNDYYTHASVSEVTNSSAINSANRPWIQADGQNLMWTQSGIGLTEMEQGTSTSRIYMLGRKISIDQCITTN